MPERKILGGDEEKRDLKYRTHVLIMIETNTVVPVFDERCKEQKRKKSRRKNKEA